MLHHKGKSNKGIIYIKNPMITSSLMHSFIEHMTPESILHYIGGKSQGLEYQKNCRDATLCTPKVLNWVYGCNSLPIVTFVYNFLRYQDSSHILQLDKFLQCQDSPYNCNCNLKFWCNDHPSA